MEQRNVSVRRNYSGFLLLEIVVLGFYACVLAHQFIGKGFEINIHPVIYILIFLASCGLLLGLLAAFKRFFQAFSLVMSLGLASLITDWVWSASEEDVLWAGFAFVLSFLLLFGFHHLAYRDMKVDDNDIDIVVS